MNLLVTDKLGCRTITVSRHVWYIFWINMIPQVLCYINRSHVDACFKSENQKLVHSCSVSHAIKADKKRKLKLKMSNA